MEQKALYKEISTRTGGDVYIGVVGPVRTGKSTFIKRFMETMVIPNIENVYKRERAKDELPQSASGRTIMTAEPKFIPEEAAEVSTAEGGFCRVRLVDCVGYLVDGALGSMEDDLPRMVSTPWGESPITMSQAAEIGTRKVIEEHSTIGLVITTDGTFSEIPRESYIPAEDRVIEELKQIGKPFLTLINSAIPDGEAALNVQKELREKHGIEALPVNCQTLSANDVSNILAGVLYEFPVQEIAVELPRFIGVLPAGHNVREAVYGDIREAAIKVQKMRDMQQTVSFIEQNQYVSEARVADMDLGVGKVRLKITLPSEVFYQIVAEKTGVDIKDDADLIPLLSRLAETEREYQRIQGALDQAQATGYGVVMPQVSELSLEAPEIIKQGGRYGVRLCASATAIHLIRTEIKASVTPLVGTEKQSEELVHYMLGEFDGEPEKIWETNIFGKSLNELVNEELSNKLARMPADARDKFRETLEKIINESTGGLICILL